MLISYKTDAEKTAINRNIDGFIVRMRPDRSSLPVCVCILGWLVSPATNTVKVIINEVRLMLLCCGMCFTYIYLYTFIL